MIFQIDIKVVSIRPSNDCIKIHTNVTGYLFILIIYIHVQKVSSKLKLIHHEGQLLMTKPLHKHTNNLKLILCNKYLLSTLSFDFSNWLYFPFWQVHFDNVLNLDLNTKVSVLQVMDKFTSGQLMILTLEILP